jgi:hypothetical protein
MGKPKIPEPPFKPKTPNPHINMAFRVPNTKAGELFARQAHKWRTERIVRVRYRGTHDRSWKDSKFIAVYLDEAPERREREWEWARSMTAEAVKGLQADVSTLTTKLNDTEDRLEWRQDEVDQMRRACKDMDSELAESKKELKDYKGCARISYVVCTLAGAVAASVGWMLYMEYFWNIAGY